VKIDAVTKLTQTARKTLEVHAMVEKGQSILAGISGGPDSVGLLLFLFDLQKENTFPLGVAHVHHGLRGEDADRDAEFVRRLAQDLDLPFFLHKADVGELARKNKLSLEEAGREERYRFFREICWTRGYDRLALAHTSDDNAEQVLMNLLRGSGPRGLAGIPFVRDEWIIRPFLELAKADIMAFLEARGQAFCIDGSNMSDDFLRNRIRNRLLPHLAENYNPSISNTLNRLSRIVGEEEAFMEIETRKAFRQLAELTCEAEVIIDLKGFNRLHPAMARRVARHAVEKIKGDLRRITLFHMDAAIALAYRTSPEGSLDLPGQVRIFKNKKKLCFKKEQRSLREAGRLRKLARRRKDTT